MNRGTLLARSLRHHRRAGLAVALGALAGSAALTGALLVGDSMRASLRSAALGRLGNIDSAAISERFFREALAREVAESPAVSGTLAHIAPVVALRGSVTQPGTSARVNRVAVLGVDDRFWGLGNRSLVDSMPSGRDIILNRSLADEIGAETGEDVILRIGRPADVPTETLLGRRDRATVSIRLTVSRIIPTEDLGAFGLNFQRLSPPNAFVPLATLQDLVEQRERVNLLLAAGAGHRPDAGAADPLAKNLRDAIDTRLTLADLGLRLRINAEGGYLSLESDRFLLDPGFEQAALAAAKATDVVAEPVLAYLANRIAIVPRDGAASETGTGIPYSTIAALPSDGATFSRMSLESGGAPALRPGEILLNAWAARDLNAAIGDRVELTYYVTGPFGELRTETHTFDLAGVVRLEGAAADPGLVPQYPGITDVESVSDWDPPFQIDLSRVRDKDEAYWDEHRATPKAFVTLEDGLRLWTQDTQRHGRVSSVRIPIQSRADPADLAGRYQAAFLGAIDAGRAGIIIRDIRAEARKAGEGSTDFGMLFVGFSFFLIVSAAMLVALLFRLGVERRAGEIGLLRAVGWPPGRISSVLLAEGAILAAAGSAAGLLAAMGYAWLMLAGLGTWWSAAAPAPSLQLHVTASSVLIGFVAALGVAVLSIAWAIRGLGRMSPGALLAGAVHAGRPGTGRRSGRALWVALVSVTLAAILIAATYLVTWLPETATFFGSGVAMLVACLACLADWLGRGRGAGIQSGARFALTRLGIRNAPRHPGRSMLTAALIASATFVIAALQAFRLDPGAETGDPNSGTGGFALVAEAAVPLPYDLNTPDGRESLRVAPESGTLMAECTFMPFRLRPGDETSCLNLYVPTQPRILGVPCPMIHRGGFRFGATAARSPEEKRNPWVLLEREWPDGAIPVIGDEAAVKWQLHSGLGRELTIRDDSGRDVQLRFVALLKGSVLQGELLIHEEHFTRLFPSIGGQAFFLVETPAGEAERVQRTLERELADYAVDAFSASGRLADYFAVQNTYLSTFQTLGGLGLVLGSVGLAAVLLRNVWERRHELALMRALGFMPARLGWMVLVENGALVLAGLAAGMISALVAVAPHMARDPGVMPWGSLALIMLGVLAAGLGVGATALIPALRSPLLPALRSE